MQITPLKHYKQIQPEERVTLASLHFQKFTLREVARTLGRAPSTITRELSRNSLAGHYASKAAVACAAERRIKARSAPKLHQESVLFGIVHHLLCIRWSPEQISMTLSATYPKGHEHRVSHETIYNCIYAQPVGELKRDLIKALRQAHNKRVPRSKGQDRRGQIRGSVLAESDMMGFGTGPCRGLRPPTYEKASPRRSVLAESDMMGFGTGPCRSLRPPTYGKASPRWSVRAESDMMGFGTGPCRSLRPPTYEKASPRRVVLAESDMMCFGTGPCRGLRPPTYEEASPRWSVLSESDMIGFGTGPCRSLRPPTYDKASPRWSVLSESDMMAFGTGLFRGLRPPT